MQKLEGAGSTRAGELFSNPLMDPPMLNERDTLSRFNSFLKSTRQAEFLAYEVMAKYLSPKANEEGNKKLASQACMMELMKFAHAVMPKSFDELLVNLQDNLESDKFHDLLDDYNSVVFNSSAQMKEALGFSVAMQSKVRVSVDEYLLEANYEA